MVTGNHSDGSSGGIFNAATLTLDTGTSVTANSADDRGGGILNNASPAVVTVKAGASVTGNTAAAPGSGIANFGTVILEPGGDVSNNQPDDCVNLGSGTGCPSPPPP